MLLNGCVCVLSSLVPVVLIMWLPEVQTCVCVCVSVCVLVHECACAFLFMCMCALCVCVTVRQQVHYIPVSRRMWCKNYDRESEREGNA